jgi:hypothetical protein
MRLNKEIKVDTAIFPTSISSTVTYSPYYSMKDYSKALFVWNVIGAYTGITLTSTATVYQAKDGSAATSAAGLAGSTAILTASAKLTRLVLTPDITTSAEGTTVTLTTYDAYGVTRGAYVYTGTAATSLGTYVISGGFSTNTAAGTATASTVCTYLATTVNAAALGVYGSATTTTITFRPLNGGETVFLFTASNTTLYTVTTAYVQGMIEVDASNMTVSSNFTHLAFSVSNESAYLTSAVIIRGGTKRKSKHNQAAVFTDLG